MKVFESVVITGGGGMLARALADALKQRGVTAHLAGRSECDVSNPDDVARLFDRHAPTLVLNCAAHTKVDLCETDAERASAINGVGPGLLAAAAKTAGCKIAHFSTDFVFDGASTRPYLPNDATNPLSIYGQSKLQGEKQVMEASADDALIVRTAWLYGHFGHCFPRTILKVARAKLPLTVVNDQFGSPSYTPDVAGTVLALVERGAKGIFHVTGSGKTSWFEFAKSVLEVFGVQAELKAVSTADWLRQRPGQAPRPRFSVLDCSQTEAVTGTAMPRWYDGLIRYHDADVPADVNG